MCIILGDNIYCGHGSPQILASAVCNAEKNIVTVFGYHVSDPQRYGVIEFDDAGKILSIEDKPSEQKSSYVVTGLYFYPNDVVNQAFLVAPSERVELEITSVNKNYFDEGRLSVEIMGRGYAWLDTGTHESLLEASVFIETIEKRQGLKVSCIEEIAFEMGYISKEQLVDLAQPFLKYQYGQYFLKRAEGL